MGPDSNMTDKTFRKRLLKARRDVIALDFPSLNEAQLEAVMATEGPLLLLAGAGSGKTTVLISRIANLLKYGRGSDKLEDIGNMMEKDLLFLEEYAKKPDSEQAPRALALTAVEPVEPWRIIAITFTNKAADELKGRLEDMLGPEAADVWAMTFHAACVRILRRDIERLGFDRSFTIYDTSDSQSLMKRILKELDLDDKTYPPKTVLNYISRAKDAMISADEFYASADKTGDIRKKQIGRAYQEYARRLKAAGALDFDDLILFTVRLLTDYEDVRSFYQRKFKYVLIDEYQDTNHLQYLLAGTLAGGRNNICVVGDDDQSIYKFRGATIENILSFENEYKDARVIRLEQNYRSTGHILGASNAVIRNNQGRKGKELWTDQCEGDKLTLYLARDERDEAQYVAGQILADVERGGNFRDHAVLYRMNAQSNQLEYAFKRSGIPYRVIGGMQFFERAEVKDMLSYLCAVNNPDDDLRLLRIINNPPRGIGQKTIETVLEIAGREFQPVYETLKRSDAYDALKKAAPRLQRFVETIEGLRNMAQTMPLDEFYDHLLEHTGYIRALEEKAADENITRIENVRELKTNIIAFVKETEGGTLADFLDEIALYTDLEQYSREDDCVVLMTMHSAKGLEFPTVFVVGAEEGIFPSIRAIGELPEMEEERRLCYVAMTRAKCRLIFTSARQRMLFGRTTAGKVSRFVEEIPEEYIMKPAVRQRHDFIGGPETRSSERKPKGRTLYYFDDTAPENPVKQTFQKGDTVSHRAFGRGLITSVQPVGGDALIEIAFDGAGTKRLMMNAAAKHMTKI